MQAYAGNHKVIAVFVCTVLLLAGSITVAAKPDMTGIWVGAMRGGPKGLPKDPPLTAAGRAVIAGYQAEHDPITWCQVDFGRTQGAPIVPFELLQRDDRVTLLYEYGHQVMRVFMDGRGHPEDLPPSFMGHSTGQWQGDTLIIETVNLSQGYFRDGLYPYSESARVVSRYDLSADGNSLVVERTVYDKEFYSEPWSWKNVYRPADQILDFDCPLHPFEEYE